MELLELFKENLLSQNLPAGRQERPLAKVTVKNYLSDIRKFFEWFEITYQTPVNSHALSQNVLSTFLAHITQEKKLEHLSQPSIDRLISSLRKFFTFLKDEGLTDNNPFATSPVVQKEKDAWRLREFKDSLYVSNFTGVSIKNYIVDIQAFKVWYEKTIGEENGLNITQAILEVYKDRLLNILHLAPRSINRKLSSIRKYAEFLDKDSSLLGDPVANIILAQEPENASIALEDLSHKDEVKKISFYSKLAPVRLILFAERAYSMAEDFIAQKIVENIRGFKFLKINIPNKTLFDFLKKGFSTNTQEVIVKNIKKEFYAPHLISLTNLPLHKKIWHHVQHTRPQWYKRYHSNAFAHYLHVSILIIFSVSIGYILYQNLIEEPGKKSQLFAAPAQPLKVYSFQGRLTDASDNPITSHEQVRFILYDDITASGASRLWEEVRGIDPDQDGIFSILLASDPATGGNAALCNGGSPPASPATDACGIPQSLFRDNAQLFLGISIGNDSELTPRQQLATVAYATNAEVLQGLPPITQVGAASTNVVLALDSSGNLTIANSASPTFQASGGQFKLMGQPLVLATNASSNGNIQLIPDDLGKIDLQKPIINDGASGNLVPGGVEINDKFGVLATESAVAAFIVNNNTAGGDILTASSSGTSRFTIGNLGAITANAYTNNGGIIYTQTSGVLAQSTVGVAGQCLQSIGGGAPTWGACGSGGGSNWRILSGALSPVNDTLDILVGSSATTSAKFAVLNINSGTPVASIAGTFSLGSAAETTRTIGATAMNKLQLGDASTGDLVFAPANAAAMTIKSGGNVGIGTTNPTTGKLHVVGTYGIATEVAYAGTEVTGNYSLNIINSDTTTNNRSNIWFGDGTSGAGAIIGAVHTNHTSDYADINFATRSTDGFLDRMRILATGNVGIGTTAPTALLHVNGGTSGGNAAAIVNQTGASGNDILSASASGTTRFTLANNGSITQT
ncbi:MAG: hypothetical protein COX79_02185, partial [Candidatus Levybacteria bacterium CG_4_10_14_0_2_um_filter_36_16]